MKKWGGKTQKKKVFSEHDQRKKERSVGERTKKGKNAKRPALPQTKAGNRAKVKEERRKRENGKG